MSDPTNDVTSLTTATSALPMRARAVLVIAWLCTAISTAGFFIEKAMPVDRTPVDPEGLAAIPMSGYTLGWVAGVVALGVNMLLRFRSIAPDREAAFRYRLVHAVPTIAMLLIAMLVLNP